MRNNVPVHDKQVVIIAVLVVVVFSHQKLHVKLELLRQHCRV